MINNSSKNWVTLPSYLVPLRDSLVKAAWNKEEQQSIMSSTFGQSYFALFEIIDTPIDTIAPIPAIIPWTGSTNSGNTLSRKSN